MGRVYDYAIKNGTVIDGTGTPGYPATVYVLGDKIAEISFGTDHPSQKVIDASGLAVAPGFMDIHTHSDTSPYCGPGFESAVSQGVTFHMIGNCGNSLVPNNGKNHDRLMRSKSAKFTHPITGKDYHAFDAVSYCKEVSDRGIAINLGILAGHNAIRECVMEDPSCPEPSAREMEEMCALAEEMLCQGAMGLSLGLTYFPGVCARTEELTALAKVAKKYDVPVAVHMRSETGSGTLEALREMEQVALGSGAHIHISHLKVMYPHKEGAAAEVLGYIDDMRRRGIHITCDQYPYTATSTQLNLLPAWAKKKGTSACLDLLCDESGFEKLQPGIKEEILRRRGAAAIQIANTRGAAPALDGKTLEEAAVALGKTAEEVFRELFIACQGELGVIYHAMEEADLLAILGRPDIGVGSDGWGYDMVSRGVAGMPHPRAMGTFPRALRLIRDHDLMPIEEAVRKITGLPAELMKIESRGILRPGNFADITVFDPKTVTDRATFTEPALPSEGIYHVFVNGEPAYYNGTYLNRRAGHVLLQQR